MDKKTIAIVSGGLNEEREISLKSANYILENLDLSKYDAHLVYLDGKNWYRVEDGAHVDKNSFEIVTPSSKISFDCVVLMIHGSPAEDGKLQGYFDLLGIPHTTCDTLSSALTFNKHFCKDYLNAHDILQPFSITLSKGDDRDYSILENLRLPLFVKPNQNGSSVGISKVEKISELKKAIEFAFKYDDEILVEEGVIGREFSCGVIEKEDELIAFPITEIIPYNDFFDYAAKYKGESDEITPADISDKLTFECQKISKRAYQLLGCKGVVRFDYMLREEKFYLLETNTVPGLSPQSIIPQQARAYGWTDKMLVEAILQTAFIRSKQN